MSPNHSSQQDDSQPQKSEQQQAGEEECVGGGGGGGRRGKKAQSEGRGRHRSKKEEDSHRDRPAVRSESGVSGGKEDSVEKPSAIQQHSQPLSSSSFAREKSEERDRREGRDDDTLGRRRSRPLSGKVHSLPRRPPTGDPMLHHMMQFQNLELHSSRGTLLSDSDNSAAGTTSPIVSTCDETSECPELPRRGSSRPVSREPRDDLFGGGHIRSHSLPQAQTERQSHTTPQHLARNARDRHSERDGRREVQDSGRDNSISEERGTKVQYMCVHVYQTSFTSLCILVCVCCEDSKPSLD